MEKEDLELIDFLYQTGLNENPHYASAINYAFTTGDTTQLKELVESEKELIEIVTRSVGRDEIIHKQQPFYPYPTNQELQNIGGNIRLGIANHTDGYYTEHHDNFARHVMVPGGTGAGKTMFNISVLQQLCRQSRFTVTVYDRKQTFRRAANSTPNLRIITFDKFLSNPLRAPDWMAPQEFIYAFCKTFCAENIIGIAGEGVLTEVLEKLFREKGIFAGSKNWPTMIELLKKIEYFREKSRSGYRSRDVYDMLHRRVYPYAVLAPNLNVVQGISHDTFVNNHIALELPPSKTSDYMHNFLISWRVSLDYYRSIKKNRRGIGLQRLHMVDEGSTWMSASREGSGLDWIEPSTNEIVRMGREFGQGLWLSSQETASFNQVFKSNCYIKICFKLTDGKDIKEVKESFGLSDEQAEYMHKMPSQRTAIVSTGSFDRPFLIQVPTLGGKSDE